MPTSKTQSADVAAESLLEFIDRSPSPYHAVAECRAMLDAAGYRELLEGDVWNCEPGGRYYSIRGGKTLIAFVVGAKPPTESGFRIVAAHSDSPALKVRQRPGMRARDIAYLTTEIYGSPLLHTWLDRDLKLCGEAYFRGSSGEVRKELVHLDKTLVRTMSLAIHLTQGKRIDGVTIDLHKDLPLVFFEGEGDAAKRLETLLVESANAEGLLGFDLYLADTQPSARVGGQREFISAPRLDNLQSSFTALQALLAAGPTAQTLITAIYDAEEIGSQTWIGARSNILDAVLHRVCASWGIGSVGVLQAKDRSVLLSADMAHAEHPSFVNATDPQHVPELNKGIAVKSGAKGNYAIAPDVAAWFRWLCEDSGLPVQSFMYRCDHGAGSSVGPLITTGLGVRGIDVGLPMIGMHSIRELAGAADVSNAIDAFRAFFERRY